MNTILLTTIITLLVYWLIGTIVYIATDENDKLIANYIQEKYTDSDGTKVTVVYDVI